ncbi:hypothetical protein C8F04DRAFT_1177877 [Mycena alexandri]|uniref:Uncharacterized protein n=1 Tax=Mycena alexandri TaxID=1745969 RepID=A0AAD6XA66_9AGAR|nr:hypothetical protein C8F04DRAFT_1177877 [Mycena alexandri]
MAAEVVYTLILDLNLFKASKKEATRGDRTTYHVDSSSNKETALYQLRQEDNIKGQNAGKVRFGSSSGPFFANAELERGVRFRFSSAFEREQNSGISGEIIWSCYMSSKWAATTIKNPTLNSAASGNIIRTPKGQNSPSGTEICEKFLRKGANRFGVRFGFDLGLEGANAEPEHGVRFSHLPNLNAERASGSEGRKQPLVVAPSAIWRVIRPTPS